MNILDITVIAIIKATTGITDIVTVDITIVENRMAIAENKAIMDMTVIKTINEIKTIKDVTAMKVKSPRTPQSS